MRALLIALNVLNITVDVALFLIFIHPGATPIPPNTIRRNTMTELTGTLQFIDDNGDVWVSNKKYTLSCDIDDKNATLRSVLGDLFQLPQSPETTP